MEGKNVNVRDYSVGKYGPARETLLHLLIHLGNSKAICQRLLDCGADINAKDQFGRSPLHLAVSYGNNEITEWLLNNGAYVDSQKNNKDTPLHIAADGDVKSCTLLLIQGADPNCVNNDGETPLSRAVKLTHTKVVKLLLTYGGDAARIDHLGQKRKTEMENWCEQNIANSEGNTFIRDSGKIRVLLHEYIFLTVSK